MVSGIPRGPGGARGQTAEQGREIEAGKRVCKSVKRVWKH